MRSPCGRDPRPDGRPHRRAAANRRGLRRDGRPPGARIAAPGTAGRCSSPRRRGRLPRRAPELALHDLGEHRLKDLSRAAASLPARGEGLERDSRRSDARQPATNLPPPADAADRPRARGRRDRGAAPARGRPAASRSPARAGRARRASRSRRPPSCSTTSADGVFLGRARADRRTVARASDDRAAAGREGAVARARRYRRGVDAAASCSSCSTTSSTSSTPRPGSPSSLGVGPPAEGAAHQPELRCASRVSVSTRSRSLPQNEAMVLFVERAQAVRPTSGSRRRPTRRRDLPAARRPAARDRARRRPREAPLAGRAARAARRDG